jgi:hypothetical protein
MDKETETFIRGLTQVDAANIFLQAVGEQHNDGISIWKTDAYLTWLGTANLLSELVAEHSIDPVETLRMNVSEHAEYSRLKRPILTIENLRFAFALEKFRLKTLW